MSGYRSGAGAGRLFMKQNAAGQTHLNLVTVTGNSGTTSWGQVTASLIGDTLLTQAIVSCGSGKPDISAFNTLEIGIGGAGSEVTIGTFYVTVPAGTANQFSDRIDLAVPLRVANGQRVAVRVTTPGALNSSSINIALAGVPYVNVDGN